MYMHALYSSNSADIYMAAFWTLYDLSCKRYHNHIMPSKNKQEIKVSREVIAKSVHFF